MDSGMINYEWSGAALHNAINAAAANNDDVLRRYTNLEEDYNDCFSVVDLTPHFHSSAQPQAITPPISMFVYYTTFHFVKNDFDTFIFLERTTSGQQKDAIFLPKCRHIIEIHQLFTEHSYFSYKTTKMEQYT